MAGMNGRNNKKREPWQYVLLLALALVVWFAPQAYELRGEDLFTELRDLPGAIVYNGRANVCGRGKAP